MFHWWRVTITTEFLHLQGSSTDKTISIRCSGGDYVDRGVTSSAQAFSAALFDVRRVLVLQQEALLCWTTWYGITTKAFLFGNLRLNTCAAAMASPSLPGQVRNFLRIEGYAGRSLPREMGTNSQESSYIPCPCNSGSSRGHGGRKTGYNSLLPFSFGEAEGVMALSAGEQISTSILTTHSEHTDGRRNSKSPQKNNKYMRRGRCDQAFHPKLPAPEPCICVNYALVRRQTKSD